MGRGWKDVRETEKSLMALDKAFGEGLEKKEGSGRRGSLLCSSAEFDNTATGRKMGKRTYMMNWMIELRKSEGGVEGVAWLLVCSKMQEEREAKETTVKHERARAGFANQIVCHCQPLWMANSGNMKRGCGQRSDPGDCQENMV